MAAGSACIAVVNQNMALPPACSVVRSRLSNRLWLVVMVSTRRLVVP